MPVGAESDLGTSAVRTNGALKPGPVSTRPTVLSQGDVLTGSGEAVNQQNSMTKLIPLGEEQEEL
jgi:hypothetical protein